MRVSRFVPRAAVLGLAMMVSGISYSFCQTPTFGEIEDIGDSVYRFPVSQVCTISGMSALKFSDLMAFHLADYKEGADKVHEVIGSTPKRKAIDLTQTFSSSDGSMTTRDLITLDTDESTKYQSWRRSKEIVKVRGNMKYTKKIHVDTRVQLVPGDRDKVTVKVAQQVDIEKPFFAPESIFIREAKRGLDSSTKDMVTEEIAIIKSLVGDDEA